MIIGLNASSAVKPSVSWSMALRDMRPYVALSLHDTHYDVDDIITAINHFGHEAHDPVAVKRLFETSTETGVIQAHFGLMYTALEAQNIPVYDTEEQQQNVAGETQASQSEGDHYMSAGFHSG